MVGFSFNDIFINKIKNMKKVVRLTESDLVRIVKRVISEQSAPIGGVNNGQKAFKLIKAGMSSKIGGILPETDEKMVSKGVYAIKNKADYQTCLALVKKEGYPTILEYIATDMSYGDEYSDLEGGEGYMVNWGQLDNNPYLKGFERHLQQFSPKENIVK